MSLEKVTLIRAHTHAGKDLEAGAVIEVSPATAKRLRDWGVVGSATDAAAARVRSGSTDAAGTATK